MGFESGRLERSQYEALLLGNVALRAGQKLIWDRASLKAANAASAEQYIRPEYRAGWTL